MKKLTTWLVAGLGALGVMFLSGAFERFFDWDAEQSKIGSGAFTVGAALAGAYLAHGVGVIDGTTRNMLITAGVTLGAATAFGDKVYSWGESLAGAVTKKGSKRPSGNRTAPPGDGLGDADRDFLPDPADFAGVGNNLSGGTVPSGGLPQQGGAPTYNVTVEAPEAQERNQWVDLLGGVAEAGFGALGSYLGGSGSSNRKRMSDMALGSL